MFPHRNLTSIADLAPNEILYLLDEADAWLTYNRAQRNLDQNSPNNSPDEKSNDKNHSDNTARLLSGLTIINAFFENSTRTLLSFTIAGQRLGANVVSMHSAQSSLQKGETLIDTAMTINAMHADAIVIRHHASGAVHLIADKVDCPVINAGDGRHEHPTQALLDALTIRRHKGRIAGLRIAICGDLLHSRVARSNMLLLTALGAEVRVIAPAPLLPPAIEHMQVAAFTDMNVGLEDADIVMMLRLQNERMNGSYLPSPREFHMLYGLTKARLAYAKDDALVMHPGPMNRGVEIDSNIADDPTRSLITEQVEVGVAVRMACLALLTRSARTRRLTARGDFG